MLIDFYEEIKLMKTRLEHERSILAEKIEALEGKYELLSDIAIELEDLLQEHEPNNEIPK